MRSTTRAVYVVFGALAIGAGAAALLSPGLILSPEDLTPLASHLVREQAAGFIFIGLMFFWCVRHFDERQPVHFGLLVFTGLFAAIHWAAYLEDQRNLVSPLVNSVPGLVLALTARSPTRS